MTNQEKAFEEIIRKNKQDFDNKRDKMNAGYAAVRVMDSQTNETPELHEAIILIHDCLETRKSFKDMVKALQLTGQADTRRGKVYSALDYLQMSYNNEPRTFENAGKDGRFITLEDKAIKDLLRFYRKSTVIRLFNDSGAPELKKAANKVAMFRMGDF